MLRPTKLIVLSAILSCHFTTTTVLAQTEAGGQSTPAEPKPQPGSCRFCFLVESSVRS